MIFKGTDGSRSYEFAPSHKDGMFLIENFAGRSPQRPIHASTISISGIEYSLSRRLEEGDETALAIMQAEHIKPVEDREGTFQTQSGLYVSAKLLERPQRTLIGGFDRFREIPLPDEKDISFPTEPTAPVE